MLNIKVLLVASLTLPSTVFGQGNSVSWPELSNFSFVSGRAATDTDAKAGSAAFVLKANDVVVGEPLDLEIPQYAVHVNVETGARTRVVLIQAEGFEGMKILGAIEVDSGGTMAGLFTEFELLGTRIPSD
ncbi:MAG: hypothetical protein GKR90_17715 [Pseudomonadales bacterium]|nr:hypothetical protein [Pseudomonadales bacterium]